MKALTAIVVGGLAFAAGLLVLAFLIMLLAMFLHSVLWAAIPALSFVQSVAVALVLTLIRQVVT